MTEEVWFAGTLPDHVLPVLRDTNSDRKFRLFAVACCQRIGDLLTHPQSVAAVELAERYADGGCHEADRAAALGAATERWRALHVIMCGAYGTGAKSPRYHAAAAAYHAAHAAATACEDIRHPPAPEPGSETGPVPGDDPYDCEPPTGFDYFLCPAHTASHVSSAVAFHRNSGVGFPPECRAQVELLHDIFGNPKRPVAFDRAWRSEAVAGLAQGMYESRDFGPMPILADALEDAGCADAEVLAHCRGDRPHVRGCWVVDLVLGKV